MRSEGYTVVVLCVCLSVRLSVCLSTTILGLQATRRLMSDTNIFSVRMRGTVGRGPLIFIQLVVAFHLAESQSVTG